VQVACEADPAAGGDEPFRGVVLVPLEGVAVVHRELVVEVVVPFAHGEEGGEEVVAGGESVVV